MDALSHAVEKLNEDKSNLRKELEALTIRMSQELENRRNVEDQIKDNEHDIFKLNQEVGTLTTYLQEEKEEKFEIQIDLDATMSLNESLRKTNEVMSKELKYTKDILYNFNKSIVKLDE